MKTRFALFVFCVTFSELAASGGYVIEYTVKAEGGLFLRSGPGLKYSKLMLIPNGTNVLEAGYWLGGDPGPQIAALYKEAGSEWTPVVFNGTRGWVADRFLTVYAFTPDRLDCPGILRAISTQDTALFLKLIPRPFGFERHAFLYATSDSLLAEELSRNKLALVGLVAKNENGGCGIYLKQNRIAIIGPSPYRTPRPPTTFWSIYQDLGYYGDLWKN